MDFRGLGIAVSNEATQVCERAYVIDQFLGWYAQRHPDSSASSQDGDMGVDQELGGTRFNVPRPLDSDQSLIHQSLKRCAISKDTEHTFPRSLAELNLLCRDSVSALLKAILRVHDFLLKTFEARQVSLQIDLHQHFRKNFQLKRYLLKRMLKKPASADSFPSSLHGETLREHCSCVGFLLLARRMN
jgi:hypothetical protein